MAAIVAVGMSITSCKKEQNIDPISQAARVDSSGTIQNVTYAYTIKASESIVDGNKVNIPPGSFVKLEAGQRGQLTLVNIKGAPGKPITFVNGEGQTIIKGAHHYGLKISNCSNFRLTGSGGSTQYGILIDGGHNALTIENLSSDFEVDRLEIKNAGFAGLMAKTDPSCRPETWRGNFVMKNISLHDNYIHDIKGEGFYVGNSFYSGKKESCGTVFPHEIHNLRLFNNVVKNSGCEGIQVGCARVNCEIYDNYIENYGTSPFANNQNNGLQIGEGTGGKCYNNVIVKGTGNGLILLGAGGNVVYNNVITNAGALGIFCDERVTDDGGFSIINNTIVNTGSDGIRLYSEKVPFNNIINNIVVNVKSGKYINAQSGVKVNDQNNYFHADVSTVKFANASGLNFALNAGSPAIDAGLNTASYGVTSDLKRVARPSGAGYDIGAFEFSTIAAPSPTNPTPTNPTNPTPTPVPVKPAPAPTPVPVQPVPVDPGPVTSTPHPAPQPAPVPQQSSGGWFAGLRNIFSKFF